MVKVSVIIPSWNRKEELKKCLDKIKEQTFKDYEVIVVDNNSSDGTREMIKDNFPKFKIIALNENVGAARARNIGIKKAKGELLWFLDSDAYAVKKTCLKDMVEIMKDNSIGELGGEIIDGKIRLPRPSRNQDGFFEFVEKCNMEEVESINTSNAILRKELIEKIGGFDPGYFYGFEDIEISYKIKKMGYRIIVDGRVLAYHSMVKKSRVSTLYIWQRNRVRFVILKEKILYIIFLPFIDIYTLLKLAPKKIETLKKDSLVCFEKRESILKGGLIFLQSLILAYVWTFFNIANIIKIKNRKPNFLQHQKNFPEAISDSIRTQSEIFRILKCHTH